MNDLKTLRDRINSCKDEVEKAELQEQWNQMHAEMEALKAEDERNYVGFGGNWG